jgi:alpha-tubulin suppressor-like RCC1 family protein
MGGTRSIQLVLGLALAAAAAGCGQPATGDQLGSSEDVSEVTVSLTTVPSGVLCVKLDLTGSVSKSQTFTVAAGASSASLSLGYVLAGSLSVTPSAFNVACSSVTASTSPTWVGPKVTVTVVAGAPLVVPLTLQPYSATAAVNFVPFVKAVGAGVSSSYALLSDGTVRAWGNNDRGELGDGTTVARSVPVAVSGLSGVASLATSFQGYHACAVKTNGSASCWGSNVYGQLGNGTKINSSVPVSVSGGYLFRQVSPGYGHTCGVTPAGQLTCWGDNSYGQFGNSSTTSSLVPLVPSTLDIGSVDEVQGSGAFTCARGGTPQTVVCTGYMYPCFNNNFWAENPLISPSTLPAKLALGTYHACEIVLADGSVRCMGYNGSGQLGDGTTTTRCTSAVPVVGLTGVTALAAGGDFTCALESDGTVWCWGTNYYGTLGDGTYTGRGTPAKVSGLDGVVSVAAGYEHVCAARSDGSAWCWGQNWWGSLGDGTTADRAVPVQVVF